MSFLERILPDKEAEARKLSARFAAEPPRRPLDMPIRDFTAAVSTPGSVIAEVKHRSPSHSHFRQTAAPARLAAAYLRGGAAALSVVTDEANFGTSLQDVAAMRAASGLPVLTKDFVIHPSQITAAWAAGADAVLLIARMLDQENLGRLLDHTRSLGLQALVECHDEDDVIRCAAEGVRLVGINNRNLATLETDLARTPQLIPLVPQGATKISESGINTRAQILELTAAGADAFLIGHALLLSADPGRKVRELTGREPEGKPRAKVCGLTTAEDAAACHRLGADILGVIFAPSVRQVTAVQAAAIRQAVPEARLCGVFVDAPTDEVAHIAEVCDLDLIQLHGQESPEYCTELKEKAGLPLIKVLGPEGFAAEVLDAYASAAYFLVDLPKQGAAGDKAGLRSRVLETAARIKAVGKDVLVAGGLTPENVQESLDLEPFAVDVCGGVESEPGRKDTARVAAFLQEVK
jgi:indole-3-glycerol phosphate synthase/phosphoribosylanthranilate isomerase